MVGQETCEPVRNTNMINRNKKKNSMTTIKNRLLAGCMLPVLLLSFTMCSDWNEPETVDMEIRNPKEQDPTLWARYMETLRTYKQSAHFITYTRFDNAAEKPVNEGAYLRSLPDSLDIVSIANSDRITDYDREDIPLLQEKSTRVLYLVDYAAQSGTLPDAAKLGAYLDKAVASAAELKLDGFAFTGIPLYGGSEAELSWRAEAAKLIVSKLSAAAGQDKLLVFEGDPAFLDKADLPKLDWIVLNTADTDNITELKLRVARALSYSGLGKEKLLLGAKMGNQITDENNVEQDAIAAMPDRVASLGPLGGLAIYAVGDDYYHEKMNYGTIRTAIQLMNPSN